MRDFLITPHARILHELDVDAAKRAVKGGSSSQREHKDRGRGSSRSRSSRRRRPSPRTAEKRRQPEGLRLRPAKGIPSQICFNEDTASKKACKDGKACTRLHLDTSKPEDRKRFDAAFAKYTANRKEKKEGE